MNCSVHQAGNSSFLTSSYDPALWCAFILKIFVLGFRPSHIFPPSENIFNLARAASLQYLALVLLSIPSPTLPDVQRSYSLHISCISVSLWLSFSFILWSYLLLIFHLWISLLCHEKFVCCLGVIKSVLILLSWKSPVCINKGRFLMLEG